MSDNEILPKLQSLDVGPGSAGYVAVKDSSKDGIERLDEPLSHYVMVEELQVRGRRFLPKQAIKAPLRRAMAELSRDGSCVLANGMKVLVPQIPDTFANARGYS